jgi:hypothetical protein
MADKIRIAKSVFGKLRFEPAEPPDSIKPGA